METQELGTTARPPRQTLSNLPQNRPTRVRYWVVGLTVLLGMVTYLDRACISNVNKEMQSDLHISDGRMSVVFSTFTLAYVLFEIPTAWWADRRGTRGVLTRIVFLWSILTMASGAILTPGYFQSLFGGMSLATAAACSFAMLLAIRFLFGAGEAGAAPCVAATFSRWVPANERGRMQGIFWAGAHLSAGVTPFIVVFLMRHVPSWRWVFAIFGAIGFIWTIAWYLWYRNDPTEHSWVNDAEKQHILSSRTKAAPHVSLGLYWRQLLSSPNVYFLSLMYMANSSTSYFCMTWLPTYLKERRHLEGDVMAVFAGLPLTLSVLGDLFGGATTDFLSRRFGLRIGRSGLGGVAYAIAAVAMFVAASSANAKLSIIAMSIASASVMFSLGAAWGTCLDIGGQNAGVVSATMNSVGNFAAFLIPMLSIYLKNKYSWDAPLYLISGLYVLGVVCWCFIDPKIRVFDEPQPQGFPVK
jgi:MFS transporter, ACS family, glucarate transporter